MAILMLGESSVLDGDIPRGREFTNAARCNAPSRFRCSASTDSD